MQRVGLKTLGERLSIFKLLERRVLQKTRVTIFLLVKIPHARLTLTRLKLAGLLVKAENFTRALPCLSVMSSWTHFTHQMFLLGWIPRTFTRWHSLPLRSRCLLSLLDTRVLFAVQDDTGGWAYLSLLFIAWWSLHLMSSVSNYALLLLRTSYLLIFSVIITQECGHCKVLRWLRSGLGVLETIREIISVLDGSGFFLLTRASQRVSKFFCQVGATCSVATRSNFFIALFSKSFDTVSAWILGSKGSRFLFLKFNLLLLLSLLLDKRRWSCCFRGRCSSWVLGTSLRGELGALVLRSLGDTLSRTLNEVKTTDLLGLQDYLLLAILSLHWRKLFLLGIPLTNLAFALVFSLAQSVFTGCFRSLLGNLLFGKLIRIIRQLQSSLFIKQSLAYAIDHLWRFILNVLSKSLCPHRDTLLLWCMRMLRIHLHLQMWWY